MQVNVLEAKNRLSELIRAAQAGEDVVIANRGQAVVRLTPVASGEKDTPAGSAAAILAWLQANARPAWMQRSMDAIDADIRNERDAWD